MALAGGRRNDALEYAGRGARDDQDNIPARHLLAVLYRLMGDSAGAREAHKQLLALDPLSHPARCEQFLLSPSHATRDEFRRSIRNELPHETYLELAAFYARAELWGDAATVLALAPRHPMVELWEAWLADRSGWSDQSHALLDHALASSPVLVFPFRREDMTVLRWAEDQRPSWKTRYYLALLLWSLGREDEARVQFDRCGDEPDFSPFYLSRASLRRNQESRALDDLRRARDIGPREWRTFDALAHFLNGLGRHAEALPVAQDAVRRFPHSYMLQFLLARTHLFNGDAQASLRILDTLTILPFEGARYGRDAYRHASILAAMEYLKRKENTEALRLISRARLWPERLGAGRPYVVDERLEDFLESHVRAASGDAQRAMELLRGVAAASQGSPTSSHTVIGAFALRTLGAAARGRQLLESWRKQEPGNPAARWAVLVYDGDRHAARDLERELRSSILNRSTGNQEFVLVCDVVNRLPL
jgi:tetratricopeptide (TPR) repeat protein